MAKITRIMVAPLAVNCYIIATEQHNAVAIDAGGSVPKILQFLQENGLTLQKILLTHGHYDHIGGVAELQAATGAEVYIHEADAVGQQFEFRKVDYRRNRNHTDFRISCNS